MRRTIATLVAVALAVVLTGCEPTTLTATPSTLRPACKEVTTVTGIGKPASEVRNVFLETQSKSTGQWKVWKWFETGAPGETWRELRWTTKPDGSYVASYFPPQTGSGTVRMRMRGTKMISDPGGVVSTSWYVTTPTGC